jgi:dolichol kinase
MRSVHDIHKERAARIVKRRHMVEGVVAVVVAVVVVVVVVVVVAVVVAVVVGAVVVAVDGVVTVAKDEGVKSTEV